MTSRYPQVAAQVHAAIEERCETAEFRSLVTSLLSRPGSILASGGRAEWPGLVLGPCLALGGDPSAGVLAAAAVEFVIAATNVVDDLVDHEWNAQGCSWERALSATLAMNSLAHYCVARVAERLEPSRSVTISGLISSRLTAACSGEDLDLLFESVEDADETMVLEMTRLKSGSIGALACLAGAAVATSDSEALTLVESFGRDVGIVAQLLNDLVGVDPTAEDRGSDLRRRKKTLPVAFALRAAQEKGAGAALVAWYALPESGEQAIDEDVVRAVYELGGMHYTWAVADTHRRQALGTLRLLSRLTGRPGVARLRGLVPYARLKLLRPLA